MLNNSFQPLAKNSWNDLLRECVVFAKGRKAKAAKLNVKQIVALKLYTDYDELQKEFRICFRETSAEKRTARQKEFYFWNTLLEDACRKSKDVISTKMYHRIDDSRLVASSLSGTYYGPVSTSTDIAISQQFAGDHGQILELYPSFGARGLAVSWLYNFPV